MPRDWRCWPQIPSGGYGVVRGRADVAPRRVDVVANFAQRLAFGSHGHHGTRDVNADPSAIAHRIEQYRPVVPDFLHVAARVRCVPPLPASAEAGHPLQEVLVGNREAVGLLDPRRRLVELLGPAIFGRPCQQRVVGAVLTDDRCSIPRVRGRWLPAPLAMRAAWSGGVVFAAKCGASTSPGRRRAVTKDSFKGTPAGDLRSNIGGSTARSRGSAPTGSETQRRSTGTRRG